MKTPFVFSRETCKKGAEREQCGQIRKAVSDCDILGSIQLVSNMQRSVSRCDEISGIIDQVGDFLTDFEILTIFNYLSQVPLQRVAK